jgi:Fic family protein
MREVIWPLSSSSVAEATTSASGPRSCPLRTPGLLGAAGASAAFAATTARVCRAESTIKPVTYDFIKDLPDDLRERESELQSLAGAWEQRRRELDGRVELSELHERLRRRWAIDTGMIEGLYSIDRGTTELLIERGLHVDLLSHGSADRPPSEIVGYLHDQAQAYDWLFDFIAARRALSTSYIKALHQLLARTQDTTEAVDQFGNVVEIPLLKGAWKQLPNNPRRPDGSVHEYCPPEHVDAEMDRLVAWHQQHCDEGVAAEVEAAWLHHRFTQIHPFQDGNGRVARAITSLVLIRAGRFAFSVAPDQKVEYIDALERADQSDLLPLVEFVTLSQQREFGQALSVAQALVDEQQIFGAALSKAVAQRDERVATYAEVKKLGDLVVDVAERELIARREEFNERVGAEGLAEAYHAHVFRPSDDKRHWYFTQIVECARKLDYFADTREYRDWVRLSISHELEQRASVLVISVHSFGSSFKGVLSALAFIVIIDSSEEMVNRQGPYLATEAAFTFGYLDPQDHVLMRLKEWLHTAWLSLLKSWQEAL